MTLLEEAKMLKIKGAHLMKDETLAQKIAEAKGSVSVCSTSCNEVEQTESSILYNETEKRIRYEEAKMRKYIGITNRRYLKYVSIHRKYLPDAYKESEALIKKVL